MFEIGFGEMLLLGTIALIALGPKQLPEVARAVGRMIGDFKRSLGDVSNIVGNPLDEIHREITRADQPEQSVARTEKRPLDQRDPTHEPDPQLPLGYKSPEATTSSEAPLPPDQLSFADNPAASSSPQGERKS